MSKNKVTNSNMLYRNITSKECINKFKNVEIWNMIKKVMFLIL